MPTCGWLAQGTGARMGVPGPAEPGSQRLRLCDGRWLGYAEYGDPAGAPVFYFHGTPGSRLERPPDAALPAALGIRLLALDRPGYGLSDYQPGRRFLDWPTDVAQAADALGIGRFGLLGYSGGGPYVLACAHAFPERIRAAVVVSSPAPLAPGLMAGMAPLFRASYRLSRLPWALAQTAYAAQVRTFQVNPARVLRGLALALSPADRAVLSRPEVRQVTLSSTREAFRQGARGYAWDDRLFSLPWGIPLDEIPLPVQLWQGDADLEVPVAMAWSLVGQLPFARLTLVRGEGHLLLYDRWAEVLAAARGE